MSLGQGLSSVHPIPGPNLSLSQATASHGSQGIHIPLSRPREWAKETADMTHFGTLKQGQPRLPDWTPSNPTCFQQGKVQGTWLEKKRSWDPRGAARKGAL